MASITEITELTFVAAATEVGRAANASCLIGAGSSLSHGSTLRGTGVIGGTGLFGAVSERPTPAPTTAAAQTFRSAPAADGAGDQPLKAYGDTTVLNQHDRKMRAFRGLEPWRDPA